VVGLIPSAADREKIEHLLKAYETGLISGAAKAARAAQDKADKVKEQQ
jgi:hypothetical protein